MSSLCGYSTEICVSAGEVCGLFVFPDALLWGLEHHTYTVGCPGQLLVQALKLHTNLKTERVFKTTSSMLTSPHPSHQCAWVFALPHPMTIPAGRVADSTGDSEALLSVSPDLFA